uniref:Uncharacterized protein n=1 Tax=Stegastes partitus TaxID=144197 RepID=A0A3B5AW05_9TELE
MITEAYGKEILAHLEQNLTVLVSVVVGQRGSTKNINRGSLVFISISFIVLMIISSAWLIFYFIQKIRYTSARDRSQVTSEVDYEGCSVVLLLLQHGSSHGVQFLNMTSAVGPGAPPILLSINQFIQSKLI